MSRNARRGVDLDRAESRLNELFEERAAELGDETLGGEGVR